MVEAGICLCVVGLAVRRLPFLRVWDAVSSVPVGNVPVGDAEKIGRLLERVGSRVPTAKTCLPQALAGVAMLRRFGHRPALVIGVSHDRGFAAHAWVEVADRAVVGGERADGFSVLWRGA